MKQQRAAGTRVPTPAGCVPPVGGAGPERAQRLEGGSDRECAAAPTAGGLARPSEAGLAGMGVKGLGRGRSRSGRRDQSVQVQGKKDRLLVCWSGEVARRLHQPQCRGASCSQRRRRRAPPLPLHRARSLSRHHQHQRPGARAAGLQTCRSTGSPMPPTGSRPCVGRGWGP